MKINESHRVGMYNAYHQASEARPRPGAAGKRKDQVEISEEAKELLNTQAPANPERTKKIESLKQEVSSGTYHVDAGKIAEKLLPFLLK